jgi:hypothetical protein
VSEPRPPAGCPYCCARVVERLYLPDVHVDICRCRACGAAWDEDVDTRAVTVRRARESVLLPADR